MKRLQVFDRVGVMDRTNFYAPGEIGRTRRLTPEGFLVCEGVAIARTGEQRYHKKELPLEADGAGEITVTRSPEEVFSAKTIASFEGKPVTVEHPNEFVTPDSWKKHAVGTVQNVRKGTGIEDDMLIADLLITDGEAIAYVNKHRPELSCGYDAEYEQTGKGQALQHNIIGNHVALVDRGRAGSRCSIRDSAWDSRMRDAFDPKQKRDEKGEWTQGARNQVAREKAAISAPSKISGTYVIKFPSGKYGFAGRVPKALSYVRKDGKPMTEQDYKDIAHAGPMKTYQGISYATQQEAEEALAKHALDSKRQSTITGDISMKSKFADKFMRVMQAFHQRDADTLDHELATEDEATDDADATMDARIEDALAWVDEQRRAAKASDEKKKKKEKKEKEEEEEEPESEEESEDCDMAAKKKKAKDQEGDPTPAPAPDMGVLKTGDAAMVAKHVIARAEILCPGIALPTMDAKTPTDALPKLMLKAVQTAYGTEDGKAVIEPFLLGASIEAVTLDNVAGVFTGAAELARQRNNQSARLSKLTVKDFGHAVTPQSLNEINRKFWNSRGG